jgi:ABC-type sugar transport system ATPase subunit
MSDGGDVVLEAREISKSFPGVKARDVVGLTLRSGQLTALLSENGAAKSMSVAENAGLASLERAELFGLVGGRAEKEHVRGYIKRFRVKTPSLRQPVRDLSGATS